MAPWVPVEEEHFMRRITRSTLLLSCAALLVGGLSNAAAQVTATAVLKSGQRHTGTNLFYRVDGRQVIVRTSPAEEPRFPVDQVAFIDFGGTPDPPNMNLSGSQEAVVMRDGSFQRGQIIELGHTNRADLSTPFLVTFRTEGGEERRLQSNQVARVYFAGGQPSTGSGGSVGPGGPVTLPVLIPSGTFTVNSQRQWTPTGVALNRGERFMVTASGEISIRGADGPRSSPAGTGQTDAANPMPGESTGALIGRIGNGRPFMLGADSTISAPAAGPLFLGINDSHVADNHGSFQAEVHRPPAQGRRRR
jgi:hypothetical protein